MLKITVEGHTLDLSPDTEISLMFENPMMTEDGIPAPYSLSYELPLTPRNREILGYPDRPTSREGFKVREAEIRWGAMAIASGQQSIEEVSDVIVANFNAARFPASVRKHIHNAIDTSVYLGEREKRDTGTTVQGSSRTSHYSIASIITEYNRLLTDNSRNPKCRDIVAPPIAIRGNAWPEGDGSSSRFDGSGAPPPRNSPSALLFRQLRATFINPYTEDLAYKCSDIHIGKILPTFQVGWIMDILLAGYLRNNIFSGNDDWARLRLLSLWHEKYQIDDNAPIWYSDPATGKAYLNYAEFLPAVAGNVFIKEMLRLPCASLFIRGNSYDIELNKDILLRNVVRDWNDRVIGIPVKTVERGKEYICGYDSDYGTVPADRIVTEVAAINDMFTDAEHANDTESLSTYRIASTGQVIESLFDTDSTARCKYTVIEQDMGGKKEVETTGEEDGPEQFDNTFGGEVLRTNLRRYFKDDHKYDDEDPKLRRFFYCPETEPVAGTTRPEKLVVGLYWGPRNNIVKDRTATPVAQYPYMSHTNYDAYGNRLGGLSLQFNTPDGLMERYHKEFRSWIEMDKHVLKADVRLSAHDLQALDLRDKVWIGGVKYLIRSLSVTLKATSMGDAEVEFVEVPDVL